MAAEEMSDKPRRSNGLSPTWPGYVAPFAVFLLFTVAEGFESLRPYYPWIYSVKILAVVVTCAIYARQWPAWSARGLLAGTVVGVVGVIAWVLLAEAGIEKRLVEAVPALAQLFPPRVGYNPFEEIGSPAGAWAFLAVRLLGLAVIVPTVEELLWRGFIIRYLIEEDFEQVPVGTYTFFSFTMVTLFFALLHPELVAALVWGAAINILLYQTKNLWACVVMHGITNLLLGLWILRTGAWHLW